MELNINEIITDPFILREGYIHRDGFVFTFGQEFPAVFNRIVIRSPQRGRSDGMRMGYSTRTLVEHIEFIHTYQIEKALLICDKLDFILECPTIKDIEVWPSYEAGPAFDYSALYSMPNLRRIDCRTVYGDSEQYRTTVNYSKIAGLEGISMVGDGHIGYANVSTLKELWISGNRRIRNFFDASCSIVLQEATFLKCGIQNLEGIETHSNLRALSLWHNYSLTDISALERVSKTLSELSIDACGKINDFTVLNSLGNLEYLSLDGSNTLPNLAFLQKMRALKVFTFTMKVEDGDLSNCMEIPYVSCKNRKHYNLKDKDLPKSLPQDRLI